ncbi:MAG: hypothetical protein ACR2PT_18300 [Endozoicomonas sp.]
MGDAHLEHICWRKIFNVFVPQADSIGAVAVIRSLGDHGYTVYAASCNPLALGLKSNYVKSSIICPDYDQDYLTWLRQCIKKNDIDVIIPSEGFLLAIKDHYQEFAHLLPISSSEETVYQCLCKVDVFQSFLDSGDSSLRDHIPETLIVSDPGEVNWDELQSWPMPLFIKGDGFYARDVDEARIIKAESIDEARSAVAEIARDYRKILIQSCSDGVKATVNLLFQNGHLLAESMVLATHESPHTGGLTALRHSWWHEPMYEDAVNRLKHLDWNGPVMVEYKWDAKTGSFSFIELNSRYWAALHVDLLAGIHFPVIHLDYFFQKCNKDLPKQRLTGKIRVRNALPPDFGYVASSLKDRGISISRKASILAEFFLLFFHPGIKADLLYPGDRKLYFINLWHFIKHVTRSLWNRSRGPQQSDGM